MRVNPRFLARRIAVVIFRRNAENFFNLGEMTAAGVVAARFLRNDMQPTVKIPPSGKRESAQIFQGGLFFFFGGGDAVFADEFNRLVRIAFADQPD